VQRRKKTPCREKRGVPLAKGDKCRIETAGHALTGVATRRPEPLNFENPEEFWRDLAKSSVPLSHAGEREAED
jgi:hypothetical protein